MINGSHIILTLFFCFLLKDVNGQKVRSYVLSSDEIKELRKEAAGLFAASEYNGALKDYLILYKSDPKNTEFNYRLGYCYLQTNINRKAALKHLEIAIESKEAKKEWLYFLGMAYMYNERWADAIKAFNDYKNTAHSKLIKNFLNPERMIEMCANGKQLCSKPVNCVFKNLGKSINTIYDEFNPFISADGNTLVFTSRRKGNLGGYFEDLGFYTADVYWTQWRDSMWGKAKSQGANVNSEWDEESVGITALGDKVFVYLETIDVFGDLVSSTMKGKMWQKSEMLPPQVNSAELENGACVSLDGCTIYFSSNRKEGLGGSDIWMIKKNEKGIWGNAVNLGGTINTVYDEINPYLSLDGKKLYFSSKGWNSMGSFDIFYSQWNSKIESWSEPVNIGFPINDADDNNFISLSGDERFAYVSAIRPEGFGERDIYEVEFLDTLHHGFTNLIAGTFSGTNGKIEVTKISLRNKFTGERMDFCPVTTVYKFIFAAKPGHYILHAEGYNFLPYEEDINVVNEYPPVEIKRSIKVNSAR